MRWVFVLSSNLAAVAYEPGTGRLWVRFHNPGRQGGRGYYDGVPEAVYRALLAAPSKGSYHYWSIRQAGYAWTYA
jgi:hypothetical protein